MSTWAVLATGPSMSHAVAAQAQDVMPVVAVSDAYTLAPQARAVVSTDSAWWAAHPHAVEHPGRKFCAAPSFQPVLGVERLPVATHTNSGLLGVMVAIKLGAKRVLLLGFDMHGEHYFGQHAAPLKNTTEMRFQQFRRQFAAYRPMGVEIINCTPGSELTCYPRGELESYLC